ncbi:XrtA/PEP-CTERM system histidine kinase PrsK [Paraglaciecola psychrophila]|uniref:histidine kinase n=1 Tax=Paraglaciecola psychrophila 170 TaxID=1129794 RepID=K6ZV54_9ALTE|nr:XrtA/PEP-CTERM system histidine kinase PrsK [Paraglaciecola psychrophila]AGH43648.1 sensor signal transduction histidine kinase [Paraglaciecola psychrophila 170]GAC39751.1 sensor histidine kinase [Paraglaciecola psychrophila 170]
MIATVGYAISAIGYAFLLLLLLTVRKSGLAKYLLILATSATCLWSIAPFLFAPLPVEKLLLFDNIKSLFWLLFLASCLRDNFTNIVEVLSRKQTWFILVLPITAIALPYLGMDKESWRFLLQTVIALQVLVLLEVIYRQAGENRWALKPLIIYLAVISVFEFVTFANALMVDQININYIAARGYVYSALIPLLVLAIRRVKNWGVEIYISREIVMHSTLLMVAGVYLFVMAMLGYAVNYFGGQWGAAIQAVLIVLSLSLLVTLFLSLSFRTKIKVFIIKHFFANQFDYRHEWLKLTHCLNTSESDGNVYGTALRGLIQAIDYQTGCLIQSQNGELKVLADIDKPTLNDDEQTVLLQFSAFFTSKNWIIDIEELRTKPYVYEGLKVNHGLLNSVSFQLVTPIYNEEEFWGMAVMQGSDNTSKKLNWELRDYLTAVNAQISNFLFHHQAAQELAENAQFAAFTRMSAFIVHDLKNVAAQIDLILSNAEQHKDNPEFIADTFETLHHTKARMDKMLHQLSEKNASQGGADSLVILSECVTRVVGQRCASYLPTPSVIVRSETPVVLDKDKLSNVIYHLVSNAQQATSDDGKVDVEIELSDDERYMLINIVDTGSGMSEDFIRTRLFKPFDTTKGNAGMGIGAFDAKAYLERIGGQLLVQSRAKQGTIFTLRIPTD